MAPSSCCCRSDICCKTIAVAQSISGMFGMGFGIYSLARLRAPGGQYYTHEESEVMMNIQLGLAFIFALASGLSFILGTILYSAVQKGCPHQLKAWLLSSILVNFVIYVEAAYLSVKYRENNLLFCLLAALSLTVVSVSIAYVHKRELDANKKIPVKMKAQSSSSVV